MSFIGRLERSLKLWQKIGLGFLVLILLSLVSLVVLRHYQGKVHALQEESRKVLKVANELDRLLSFYLRWKVNLLTGILNETPPKILISPENPPLKQKLSRLEAVNPEERRLLTEAFSVEEKLHRAAGKIAKMLEAEEDEEEVVEIYNQEVNPLSKKLFNLLGKLDDLYNKRVERLRQETTKALVTVQNFTVATNACSVAAAILMLLFTMARLKVTTREILTVVDRLAQGDFSHEIKVEGRDEFALFLAHLKDMLEKLRPLIKDVTVKSKNIEQVTEEMDHLAERSYREAEEAGERATRMKEKAEDILESVETESRSINEISAAIQEISQNTSRASMITKDAVGKATSAQETINRVGQASQEIEEVINIISDIAEQTKFLALNAAIEAARAGEAGKGFAVVANEVKELARQTAVSTDQITAKIRHIQAESANAVEMANEVVKIIQEIDEIASAIAAAVEEQTAVISDIAHNVSEQKEFSQEFLTEAQEAFKAAQTTLEEIKNNLALIKRARELAQELARDARRFKV